MHKPDNNKGQRHPLADESGQVLILTALCMVVLIGMLGLSVDVGMLRYQKRQLQNAADAAALAGALELAACGSTQNCAALQAAAQDALKENGLTGSTLLTNCAKSSATTLLLTVNNPPCALSTDPNYGNNSVVEVVVSYAVPTMFARIFGIQSVPILTRAEAGTRPGRGCVYALDPTGSGSLAISSTTVNASCGFVIESTSSTAATCSSSTLTVTAIAIVGGLQQSSCTFSVQPTTGASTPNPTDPLSSLPVPTIPSCGTSTASPYHGSSQTVNISNSTPVVLYPDYAYCGGITISSAGNVTFQPGSPYILTGNGNSWALRICTQATVTGTGVTFYNASNSGQINIYSISSSTGGLNLSAPTSGTYAGILFFQDAHSTAAGQIIGTSQWNTVLNGAYYFPSATVSYNYSGPAKYNFLIARDITIPAGAVATFTNDYSSLANGSPLGSSSATASLFQ